MGPASIHLGGLQNGLGSSSTHMQIHPTNEECGIREVWAHNMEEEFKTICQVRLIIFLIIIASKNRIERIGLSDYLIYKCS